MVKLHDSFTVFLYAFRGDNNFPDLINAPTSLWIKSQVQPDQSYLFNHVQKFFSHNQDLDSAIDENQALLFELKSKQLQEEEKDSLFLFNSLFKRDHWIAVEGRKINFSLFRDTSILSPKILFVPLTGVGILSFGVKLKDHCQELSELLHLNLDYPIHLSKRCKRKPEAGKGTILQFVLLSPKKNNQLKSLHSR